MPETVPIERGTNRIRLPIARILRTLTLLTAFLVIAAPTVNAAALENQHGIAMHGAPALAPGFKHFPYVNPKAPKGGRLSLGRPDTFSSLNPFIPRGVVPDMLRGYVYESLLARSGDEPFTLYSHIARSIDVAEDRSWITFHLDPRARFSDGRPIRPEDVIFSHEILRTKGHPYMRSHYGKVALAEKIGERSVKFSFNTAGDREIALIMALMPILPRHAIDAETFDQTSLAPPLGSGPYVVEKVDPGHSLVFKRNADYWARDLPTRLGLYNFDEVKVTYFRDASARFEAFKTGAINARNEIDPARWVDGYDFPAMRDRRARKLTFKTGAPAGMSGLIFNTRRDKFADIRVRRALMHVFDGPSINKSLFHGRFVRSESFFARSALASTGKPASPRERELLAPFGQLIDPDILAGKWRLTSERSSGDHRRDLRAALKLLNEAGYKLDHGRLIDQATGRQFDIELLVISTPQQRLALAYAASLKRLGIAARVRRIEASQYWSRIGRFEFDIIQWHYSASLSPGNEQINRWAGSHATIERSLNFAGAKSAAVDAMIEAMLKAVERDDFETAVSAYDRALLSGFYLVPLFHLPEQWFAAWSDLRQPATPPLLGTGYALWWSAAHE